MIESIANGMTTKSPKKLIAELNAKQDISIDGIGFVFSPVWSSRAEKLDRSDPSESQYRHLNSSSR
jgi:hypothetical protein